MFISGAEDPSVVGVLCGPPFLPFSSGAGVNAVDGTPEEHGALLAPTVDVAEAMRDTDSETSDSSVMPEWAPGDRKGVLVAVPFGERELGSRGEAAANRRRPSRGNEPEPEEKPPPAAGSHVRLRQRRTEAGNELLPERTKGSEWRVCDFSALPKWLQDNDYLLQGHRPPLPSFRACVLSVFRVHTETGNIWSHLLGSVAFATTGGLFLWRHSLAPPEQAVFAAFFFCVFLCFFTSTMYHTMHCHSEHVGKLFSRLDYCGIVSIVAGCFTPWIHFLFWCDPRTKLFYLLLGYFLCVVTINLTMWEKFGRPHYRLLRASVFTGLAFTCSLLPGVHFVAVYGLYTAFVELAFGWLLAMSLVALVGVALYALRVPERYFPGRCDILFHSHQFFHLAVIVGAYIHLRCLCLMALYRLGPAGNQCRI